MLSILPFVAAAGMLVPGATAGRPSSVGGLIPSHTGRSLQTDFVCNAPWGSLSTVEAVASVSKLQAPNSGTEIRNDELQGYCDQYYYVEDGYVVFVCDDERSELRIPELDAGFEVATVQAKMEAIVNLPNGAIGDDNYYTWFQIHGDDTSYLRLTHYGLKEGLEDYLWLYLKTGSSSSYEFEAYEMIPIPDGDFNIDVTLNSGTITITVQSWWQEFTIDWSDVKNYFKVGLYADGGNPTDYTVKYKSMTYQGPESDGVISPTTAVAPVEDEAVAPAPEEDEAVVPAPEEDEAVAPAPEEDEDVEAPEPSDEDVEAPEPSDEEDEDADAPEPKDEEDEDADAPEPDEDEEEDADAPEPDDDLNSRIEETDPASAPVDDGSDESPASAPEDDGSDESPASAPEDDGSDESPASAPEPEEDDEEEPASAPEDEDSDKKKSKKGKRCTKKSL